MAKGMAGDEQLPKQPRQFGAAMDRLGLVLSGERDAAAESAFGDLPGASLHDEAEIAALAALVVVAVESGQRWGELDEFLSRVIHDSVRSRAREAAGVAALGLARLHLLRGRYRDAARWLAEADAQLLRSDPFNTLVAVRYTAVCVASFSGDFEGAIAAQQRLESWVAEHEPLGAQRPGVARAAAWVQWMRDPVAAGQRLLADAESFAGELPGLAPALAYDALRTGNSGAIPLLVELADRCRSRLVAAFVRHATARAARDGAALLAAADEMAAIGALRYAVEAASEAATVFVAEGRSDSARRAAARERELHVPDQGASLP
jgi:hypothetical protein